MALIDEYLALRDRSLPAGRPWVTLSYAQSLDGSIARQRGQPMELSGPESMRLTHRLRAAHQAILVGIGTVLADDPRLTVRLADGPDPHPIVLDSRLRIPLEARLFQHPCQPWIATLENPDQQKKKQLERLGARLLLLPAGEDGRPSLPALLRELHRLGLSSLMVEGGASVISAFLASHLVDLLALTIVPQFVGGLHAFEPGALPSGPSSGIYPCLDEMKCERLGGDLILWGIPAA